MSLMKAVRIHQYGGRDQLQLDDVSIPSIATDEVLVKVYAAAVNPVDWKVREGYLAEMIPHQLPLILGWDFAGEVVSVGAEVSEWEVGTAVYSRPDIARNGTYAEYIAVKASEIAAKPQSVDWRQAAAYPLVSLTAWQALIDVANIQSGQRVLIQAGAGGVGQVAIQLAKQKGAYVYTTASASNHETLKALGADEVIDYRVQDFSELRGLDVVFDTIGGEAQANSWQTLKKGGVLVSIVEVPDQEVAAKWGVKGEFVFVQPNAEQLTQIANLIDDNLLKLSIDSVYSLDQLADAHQKSESGHSVGKIVIDVVRNES